MRFAKPPSGFKVNCLPEAQEDIARICDDDQLCLTYKDGVVISLRQAGHRVGQELEWPELPGARLHTVRWIGPNRALDVRIIYRVLGDTITFYHIDVARELHF